MKPAIAHRDAKPANVTIVLVRRERPPSRRGRQLLELLVDLLDKPDDSGRG